MLGYLVLGFALLIGLILISQWFARADLRQAVRAVRWTAAILGVLGLIALIFTRAWTWLPALLFTLLPWLIRARGMANRAKASRGPSAGRGSSVETAFLDMHLDHDTGHMDGQVRQGAFEGRTLSGMALGELLSLLAECDRADEQSAAVLAAYLDRAHPDWRERAGAAGAQRPPPDTGGPMSVEEARRILGVDADATRDEIKDAHRRLMKQVHPDHGGSSYLAAKINEAKETLIGH